MHASLSDRWVNHRAKYDASKMQLVMDALANGVTQIGVSGVDPNNESSPRAPKLLTTEELIAFYVTSDLAARIVDEPVEDAMDRGMDMVDPETGETVISAQDTLLHDAWLVFEEAAKVARLTGSGAVMFVTDATDLSKPMDTATEKLQGIIPLSKDEMSISTRVYDLDAFRAAPSRMGRGLTYQITPDDGMSISGDVHYTRLFYIAGRSVPRIVRNRYSTDSDHDMSVLQAPYKAIQQFLDTESAMSLLVIRFEEAVFGIPGLKDLLTGTDNGEGLINRIRILRYCQSIANATLYDPEAGETFERKFASVAGMPDLWDRFATSVARASGRAMSDLFGMQPAGLSSDDASGRQKYRKQVRKQQQVIATLASMYYSFKEGRKLVASPPGIDALSPIEQADIDLKRAEKRAKYLAVGVMGLDEARVKLIEEEELPKDAPAMPLNPSAQSQSQPGGGDAPGAATNVNREDPLRADADGRISVPDGARNNARRALGLKKKYGLSHGTSVGWARARQLAGNSTIPRADAVEMRAWFARHKGNEVPSDKDKPWTDAGYVMHLAWGGDTMRSALESLGE